MLLLMELLQLTLLTSILLLLVTSTMKQPWTPLWTVTGFSSIHWPPLPAWIAKMPNGAILQRNWLFFHKFFSAYHPSCQLTLKKSQNHLASIPPWCQWSFGMTFIYCSSYVCLFISHVCFGTAGQYRFGIPIKMEVL